MNAYTDLTDKGLRSIDLLPPENPIEGLVAILEEQLQQIEQDPDLSEEERGRKRTAIRRMIEGVYGFGMEFGTKVAAELLSKGIGLG